MTWQEWLEGSIASQAKAIARETALRLRDPLRVAEVLRRLAEHPTLDPWTRRWSATDVALPFRGGTGLNPQDVERLSENDKQASPTSAQFSRSERPGFGDHPEIHRIIGGLHQESEREPLFLPLNLQDIDETSQMRSGFPGSVDTSTQHSGQLLTFGFWLAFGDPESAGLWPGRRQLASCAVASVAIMLSMSLNHQTCAGTTMLAALALKQKHLPRVLNNRRKGTGQIAPHLGH